MSGAQFTVDVNDNGFYVTVADDVTVYEEYDDAVAEIQEKLSSDTESLVAKVAIDASDGDDVAVTLEQVGWQQVIRDMGELDRGK
jgi:hypothetical protein